MNDHQNRPRCSCGNITAINYHKNGKTYYRKKCFKCIKLAKETKSLEWKSLGYVKKIRCDNCGFLSKDADQIHVVKINDFTFKSVCLNCEVIIRKKGWCNFSNDLDF